VAKTALLDIEDFEVFDSVKIFSGDFHDFGGVGLCLFYLWFYLCFA
jgi:hypothetical protein